VVPRTFPDTLLAFHAMFPTEAACLAYLEELRWPEGFVCRTCQAKGEPFRFAGRPGVLCCRSCRCSTRITAGTVLHRTRVPLQTWFWGAYLVTAQTPGMSALQFQRQLGISRYETAFQLLHKLRAAMVRPDRDRIGGEYLVEVDETEVGGQTRGQGRGAHHISTIVGAVEVRRGDPKEMRRKRNRQKHDRGRPVRGETYAGRLRLRVVPNRSRLALTSFVLDCVAKGSMIFTDGWHAYEPLKRLGYEHEAVTLGGDLKLADVVLPLIHLVFSNLKAWLIGTHHGVGHRHLQAYLNEYTFRFNRRFYPMGMFNSVLGIATRVKAPTYRALYDGKWAHPNR
jgi:transposase-like protein